MQNKFKIKVTLQDIKNRNLKSSGIVRYKVKIMRNKVELVRYQVEIRYIITQSHIGQCDFKSNCEK